MAQENGTGGKSTEILEATVSVLQSTAKLCLTDRSLYYETQSEKKCEVLLEDLIGVNVLIDQISKRACKLTVHYFPIVSKREKRAQRKLSQMSVFFDKEEDSRDNLKKASEWKTKVLLQTERSVKQTFECVDSSPCSTEVDGDHVLQPRNILVILNPFAGDQNGETKFNKIIKPMFDLAEIHYTVMRTKHQNHAHDLVQELELTKYSGIVIASGDGLLYEVINGIMKRPDWETTIRIPVGMIPIGSGNGLAASTFYEAEEEFSLEASAFQIIRGGFTPMDLATVQMSGGNHCYMTLLANWGMIADIDIGSESMRKLGETRFTIGTLKTVARKKVYRGKLSYLPYDTDQLSLSRKIPSSIMQALREGHANFVSPDSSFSSVNWREEARAGDHDPESSLNNIASSGSFSKNGLKDSEDSCNGVNSNGNVTNHSHSAAEVDEDSAACVHDNMLDGVKPLTHLECRGLSTDLLVPLTDSLPDSWLTCRDEEFLSITPLMIPFMSKNSFGDSSFRIGSREFRLLCVRGSTARLGALKVILNTKTGKHMEMEEVYVISAKAFRIEPVNGGIMTVDGEIVETGPLQAQIHPHMLLVMSRKRL